jgi:CHAD domain-containing protein
MRRTLGPVRELEVDVAWVRAALGRLDAEVRVAAEELLMRLERRLVRARGRTTRAASAVRVARVRRAVERSLLNTARRVAEEPRPMERLTAAVFAARERARAVLPEALRSGDDPRLHAARIAVKRLRYAIETLGPREADAAVVRRARDLQHALGDVHDAAVLRERIRRRATRLRARGADAGAAALAPLLERLEEARRRALENARELAGGLESTDAGLHVVPRTGADSA